MPVEPVFVDTTIVAVGARRPPTGNLALIGQDPGGTAPDDEVQVVSSLSQAQTLFGATTDLARAAEEALAQKVQRTYMVRAARTDVVAETTLAGALTTLVNKPVSGKVNVTFGDATPPVYVYTVPSSNGEINMKDGTCWTTAATTIDYSYVDWATALQALVDYTAARMNIIVLADVDAGEQSYGDLDAIWTEADSQRWPIPIHGDPSKAVADIVTDINTYASRNVVGVASKETTKDIAAAVAGALSVLDPWDKLMWKTLFGVAQTTFFTKDEVETTLEGGKVNAVISKVSQMIMSDGLTTSTDATYKFIDIARTQYYIEELIRGELENLIRTARVAYEPAGIEAVRAAISAALDTAVFNTALRQPFVNDDGELQKGYLIDMPDFDDISAADKQNRLLQDVFITAFLAGHIQSISMNLTIQL